MKLYDFTNFARLTANSLNSDGEVSFTEKLHKAKLHFGEASSIVAMVQDEFSLHAKGAVPVGNSGNGWGNALGALASASAVYYDAIIDETLIGPLGIPRVPARTPLILSEEEAEAHWVAEGQPIPVTDLDFDRKLGIPLFKIGTIIAETKEALSSADPGAAMTTQRSLFGAFKRTINSAMLDPANAGTPGVLPPSLTYGVTTTQLGAAEFKEGLEALVASFTGDLTRAYVIGKPEFFVQLHGFENPGIGARGGELAGLPALPCPSLPDDSNGRYQLALIDPTGLAWAGDPQMIVDASRQAALELRDDPVGAIAPDPQATAKVNLWQLGLVALRATMYLNWKTIRPGSVAILNGIHKSPVIS